MAYVYKLAHTTQNDRKAAALLVIALFCFVMGGALLAANAATSYTLYNQMTVTSTLFDVGGHDGTEPMLELIGEGQRVYTTLKVWGTCSHTNGLQSIAANLWSVKADNTRNSIVSSLVMTSISTNQFQAVFDVNGYATGSYIVSVKATSLTHLATAENPAWPWSHDMPGYELDTLSEDDLWQETGAAHPTKTITFWAPDVDIINTPDRRVWVANPWADMSVTLKAFNFDTGAQLTEFKTDGFGVSFSYDVITGSMLDYSLAVYDAANNRVVGTTDLSTFVFNAEGGQSDGTYSVNLYYTGNPGWKGGKTSISLTVDNPEDISGITEVYQFSKVSGWVLAPDGSDLNDLIRVRVVVSSTLGNIQSITCKFTSSTSDRTYTYALGPMASIDGATVDLWAVEIDTTRIPNGVYDVTVYAIRLEDGATCFLSAWSIYAPVLSASNAALIVLMFLFGAVDLVALLAYVMFKGDAATYKKRSGRYG